MSSVAASGPRPRIPSELARRIDRLARGAHAFHRFAHHPLCSAYAGEVYALGRSLRVCRGCALGVLGALFGIAAGLAFSPSPTLAWGSLLTAAGLACMPKRFRLSKYGSRLVPATLAAFAAMSGLAPAVGAVLIVLAWFARYRRVGPDRAPCEACAERGRALCGGIAPIIRRERALQRLAGQWLTESTDKGVVTHY